MYLRRGGFCEPTSVPGATPKESLNVKGQVSRAMPVGHNWKEKSMKTAIATAACVLLATAASAQDTDWQYSLTTYLWTTKTGVSAETPTGETVDAELSFSDALKDLEFAFMGAFEARKGKLSQAARAEEHEAGFVRARRRHSAVESAINALEVHGLDRCLDHGLEGFKRYVALAVVARNIQRLGAQLRQQEAQRQRGPYRRAA